MKKLTLLFLLISTLLFSQKTITMKKEGGVYTVPCLVNGLPLKFIFDTGASDVSISLTEAIFMMKNGYLRKEDIGESVYYSIANGDVAKGTRLNIREIEFAGLKLNNVEASIVHEASAPLLLGQSVIGKLGKIMLEGNKLTILNQGTENYNYFLSDKELLNSVYTDIKQGNNKGASKKLTDLNRRQNQPTISLEIAKLFFVIDEISNSKSALLNNFSQIQDPIKYKLLSYIMYYEGDYNNAKENIEKFVEKAAKQRVQIADQGLIGLINAGLASFETNVNKKNRLFSDALKKIDIPRKEYDATMDWEWEIKKIKAAIDAPQSQYIDDLNKRIAANAKDGDALVKIGTAYYDAKNWHAAILTWDKLIALMPSWTYSYYAKGTAYQQLGKDSDAENSYQKFIDELLSQNIDKQNEQREALSYAYFLVAYYNKEINVAKAKDYVAKSIELNPHYQDSKNLSNYLKNK